MLSKEDLSELKEKLNKLNENVPMQNIKDELKMIVYNLMHNESLNETQKNDLNDLSNSMALNKDWDFNFVNQIIKNIINIIE